jgi:hypothetical protein
MKSNRRCVRGLLAEALFQVDMVLQTCIRGKDSTGVSESLAIDVGLYVSFLDVFSSGKEG